MPTPVSNRFSARHLARYRGRRRKTFSVAVAVLVVVYLAVQLQLVPPSSSDDASLMNSKYPPDAYFNNFPVRLRTVRRESRTGSTKRSEDESSSSFRSSVHCVGETHDSATAWKHRSCSYVHLCLDLGGESAQKDGQTEEKPPELFLVASKSDQDFQNRFRRDQTQSQHRYSSTEMLGKSSTINNSTSVLTSYSPLDVAVGGINPSWRAPPKPRVPYQHGIDKIRWAPRVYESMPFDKYYELDPNVVMIPFHSFAAANVGHLLWDDFLPLYNLLKIFGYETTMSDNNREGFQHLLLRVDTMPGLFGTCDLRPKKKEACKRNLQRFLPLFGADPDTFSTLTEARLTKDKTKNAAGQQSVVGPKALYPICSKRAVAGLGWLTDHGTRNHGWMTNNEEASLDVALAHNVGRGPELYAFRNFLLTNLGMETFESMRASTATRTTKVSFRMVLSARSSNHPDRSFGLQVQQKALAKAFPHAEISVVDLSAMPLLEQISLVSNQPPNRQHEDAKGQLRKSGSSSTHPPRHTIFISACGGGSATAYFLPRGSSLVLYYNEVGGMDYFDNEAKTGGPALLDWDLMNNLGYLRVHWLPISSMDSPEGLDALVALVQHEMDGVLHELMG